MNSFHHAFEVIAIELQCVILRLTEILAFVALYVADLIL